MTYREKFALLDKENKSPIEELFERYYMFQFSGDLFCEYDKGNMSKEELIYKLKIKGLKSFRINDNKIIYFYKKDDDIKEFCTRIYYLLQKIIKYNKNSIEKLRKLFINASYKDYDYIIRKQKRIKFRKTIKRKRGK
jgi:hypothetical protein